MSKMSTFLCQVHPKVQQLLVTYIVLPVSDFNTQCVIFTGIITQISLFFLKKNERLKVVNAL